MLQEKTEATPKPTRRIPRGAVFSLVGTVVLTVGLATLKIDFNRWGNGSYGALFVLMVLTNATVILPAPGLGLAILAAKTLNPILVGLVSGLAAGLGESTGWLAGRSGGELVHLDDRPIAGRIKRYVQRRGMLTVFVLAAIPSPLVDVAGLAAGAMGMPWWKFVGACIVGKTVRFVGLAFASSVLHGRGVF